MDTRADRGETLLELLIAVAILGIVVVAIIGTLFTSILVSDSHAKQATAQEYVHDYAEAIENVVAGGGYVSCATISTYQSPTGFALPTGYTKSVKSVQYWSGTTWNSTCDSGVQQITVSVSSSDNRATEQLVFVVRKPCGTGATPCPAN